MWPPRFKDQKLPSVWDKIQRGERLEFEEGLVLLHSQDLEGIRIIADEARKKRVGEDVYYIDNYHLYYSNVCAWRCKFCAFSRHKGQADAYTKSVAEIICELQNLAAAPTEIRITGGINPELRLDYFLEILSWIKEQMPQTHIEAFAPTEIDDLCEKENLSEEEVLTKLRQAGLGSLTCGGAEIFDPQLRFNLCPQKSESSRWLEVVTRAHSLGIPSNASILYGHVESYSHRIEHLLLIRQLQDKTKGFNSFIPLCFLPANTKLSFVQLSSPSEILKMVAVCRLMLDNIRHIKFLWIYHGLSLAGQALDFGANDLGGTVNEKHKGVARSAGSLSSNVASLKDIKEIILMKGRLPVERGFLYQKKQ